MDKAAILELLKENLTIELDLDISYGSFGSGDHMVAKVKVMFDGEEITSDETSMSIPRND